MSQAALMLEMLLFAAAFAPSEAAVLVQERTADAFLASQKAFMRPDIVARTLAKVDEKWAEEVVEFSTCNATATQHGEVANCNPEEFQKSCPTVVRAIVTASSGDRDAVDAYMVDVCGQAALAGEASRRCRVLAVALNGGMTVDSYTNRESLDASHLCQAFWSGLIHEERHRAERVIEEREEQEKAKVEEAKQLAEEAERKAQEEKKQEEEASAKAAAAETAANASAMESHDKEAADTSRVVEEAKRDVQRARQNVSGAAAKKVASTKNASIAAKNATRK